MKSEVSNWGGVIQEINSSKVIADNVKSNKIETNESSINSLTTNNITNSNNITTKDQTVSNKLTCKSINSTNINNTNNIESQYLEAKLLLTINGSQIMAISLAFNIIYNGTAASSGTIMMEFENITGLCIEGNFDAIELISCAKEIVNLSSFTITNTYKCSVGLDINNLMKCRVFIPGNSESQDLQIKYIVGTFYSENSPSCIYQYATGYGNSNQLMRGNNIRFPVEHAVFAFKYIGLKYYDV